MEDLFFWNMISSKVCCIYFLEFNGSHEVNNIIFAMIQITMNDLLQSVILININIYYICFILSLLSLKPMIILQKRKLSVDQSLPNLKTRGKLNESPMKFHWSFNLIRKIYEKIGIAIAFYM